MTLIETTVALLHEVSRDTNLSVRNPSPVEIFDLYRRLIQAHTDLGQEQCQRFSAKEAAYIRRKIADAKAYKKNRTGKTVKDAETESLIEIESELIRQNETAELYETYRVLRTSVDKAISYIQSLRSYVSKSESLPSA